MPHVEAMLNYRSVGTDLNEMHIYRTNQRKMRVKVLEIKGGCDAKLDDFTKVFAGERCKGSG